MAAYLILTSVVFISGASAGILLTVIIGIRRGDYGKRFTGPTASNSEAFARRLLTGSRGYDFPGDAGGGPVIRITDLSAVATSAGHCAKSDCKKCRARFRWMRRKAWRSRKSVNRRMRGRKG
jgi:hypothetical protein